MGNPTRRQFLQAATISSAGMLLFSSRGNAADKRSGNGATQQRPDERIFRLDTGWEFHSGPLSEAGDAWAPGRGSEWEHINLPHCFNAMDACDPDKPYFRGYGWYRTRLSLRNPYANGRTLLHFQGAGQTSTLWIGSKLAGTHVGGYDEFAFDITDAVAQLAPHERAAGVPVVVLCDNTPNRDRIPSDLSDFCLYGGLYRHVNLVYLPALALEAIHILPVVNPDGGARVSVKARLYNPSSKVEPCEVAIEVRDPARKRNWPVISNAAGVA